MTSTEAALGVADVEAQLARLFEFDPELIADPFPLYARAREVAPVVRVGSVVVVTRYDDIKAIFRDPENFSNIRSRGSRVTDRRTALTGEDRERYDYLITNDLRHIGQQDEPEHTRLRRFVNDPFSAARVNAMREQVAALAEDLLDGIVAEGNSPFDLARYSYRVPLVFMTRLLGIPDVQIEEFRTWALDLRVGLGTNHD
jgi:cytochrome P450